MDIEFIVKIDRDNNESYEGNIINGFRDGYGRIEHWTSRVEIGTFKNNKKNGYFIEKFDDKKRFEGYYVDDKKNGFGRYYSLNGDKLYEGEHKDNKRHGQIIEFDRETRLINGNVYYKEDKLFNGIKRSSDFDDLWVNYNELTIDEKSKLIEEVIDNALDNLDEEEKNSLECILGTLLLDTEHVEWLIEKFIESNYDIRSIYGKVVGIIFDGNKVMFSRYVNNLEVSEYLKGNRLKNNRFEEFLGYFEDDFYENSICKVKDIYFRENRIIEFVEKFIEKHSKDLFDSINKFLSNWLNVLLYITEKYDNEFYYDFQDFLQSYANEILGYDNLDVEEYFDNNMGKAEKIIDNKLLLFLRAIEKNYQFKSSKEAIFSAWLLLYYKVIEYYSKLFLNQITLKYEDLLEYNLEQCIEMYSSESRFNWSEFDKIIFISFLINERKILDNLSFYQELMIKRGLNLRSAKFNILEVYENINKLILSATERKRIEEFENSILNLKEINTIDIEEIDSMNGYEFEEFICQMFIKQGYKATVTQKANDQGIDIIIKNNGKNLGVQAKRYTGNVGNTAIQEVVAGLAYYKLDRGIVITNSNFTKSAVKLAQANNILLWDREKLIEKIKEIEFLCN